ncbi:lipopolysaccharide biosynthesis protein [uncultured Alsobacter sp.]|uniref:lipopolysaccharide biosynthesis protein n=1 Tax=uncultured Alsobacter sp. TaxID=1748258 RepID=UPI0025F7D185|nr:polysaccharide biosynthesis C-terminal domain-containing protein [uncultured Alsobacter sp.]
MALIASFLFNAVANFALGLLLARYLGPQAFGVFAVAMAGAGALAAPALDWLRHAGTRFYSARSRTEAPEVRATLDAAVAAIAGALLTGAAALALFAPAVIHDPGVAALALVSCALGGLFDYATALMRARFMQRDYAGLVILKNLLTLVPMPVAAVLTGDPRIVLAAGCVGQAVCLAVAVIRLADPGVRLALVDKGLLRRFAVYGMPLTMAGGLAMVQAFYNRGALASLAGYAEAGRFALAYDIGVRLVAVTAMALDVLLFQLAVRAEAEGGRAAGLGQVARNLGTVVALLAPVTAGYALVLHPFESVFIAADFQGAFAAYSLALLPGLAAWAFMQFGLSPAFQITGSTLPMAGPNLLALAINVAMGFVLAPQMGPIGLAHAFSIGMIAGLASAAGLVRWRAPIDVPWRTVAGALVCSAAMAAAVLAARQAFPERLSEGWTALAGSAAIGGAVYLGLAFAFDLAGGRSFALARLRRRPAP